MGTTGRGWLIPDWSPTAKEAFDAAMPGPHQIHRQREDVTVAASDLLSVPPGTITEAGLCQNVDVGVQYLAAWLGGNGCVPIYNLMEDAATAEISRTQLWQWLHHPQARLDDGRPITESLCRGIFDQQLAKLERAVGPGGFSPRALCVGPPDHRRHFLSPAVCGLYDVGGVRVLGRVVASALAEPEVCGRSLTEGTGLWTRVINGRPRN